MVIITLLILMAIRDKNACMFTCIKPDTNMSTPVKINLEWLGHKWIKWCIILALVLICSLYLLMTGCSCCC